MLRGERNFFSQGPDPYYAGHAVLEEIQGTMSRSRYYLRPLSVAL